MSKVTGFIVGAALVVVGFATGNVGLIIQGGAMIVTQAVVDLTMPKQPARQASEMTLQLGEQPRCALFGETFTPGSLVDGFNYGGKYGTDWEVLIIRLADHKCESLTGFFVNDEWIPYTGDGNYPHFDGDHFSMWFRADTTNDPLPSVVTDHGPGWTATDIGESGCDVIVAYRADGPKAKKLAWPGGRPHFGFVVKGKQCYDPRLDDTVPGGAGPHRFDDPATWEWSENAVICWYNYERGIYADGDTSDPSKLLVGRGLSAEESPPETIFAAANLCDEIAGSIYPYRTRVTTLSSSTDQFYFSPAGGYAAHSNSTGLIEWWDVLTQTNLGLSSGPGFATGSVPNTAVASDGTAYQVGTILVGPSVKLAVTSPLGTPVLTTTDSPTIDLECTRVLEGGGTTTVLTAYGSNAGYLDMATHVAHAQSLRDACIDSDGNVAKLFQPTGSSADFTIECNAGNFTIAGSAAARSGPTSAYICHVASLAAFRVFSDGYTSLVDAATGTVLESAAADWGVALPKNSAESKPNLTSVWQYAGDGTFKQWSLEDGSLIQSVPTANFDAGTLSISHWAYDALNDAIWTNPGTTVKILLLDRHGDYRVAGPVYSTQEFLDVEGMFAAATAGNIITHEGQVLLEPGQAKSVVATFTDDDLLAGAQVSWNQGFLSESNPEWVNTVVAQYVEPDQKWNSHAAPVVRDTADIIADGKAREAQLTLRFVRYQAQALRVAEINRRLGRLWGRASVQLGPRFCEIEEGDWISWQSDRYFAGASKTFQVQAYSIDEKWRIKLTLREISASVYADDATFPNDQSQPATSPLPPEIGSPDAADWTLTATVLESAGAAVPALEITGAVPSDEPAEEVLFEYWKDDGVTNPLTDPDAPAWIMEGSHPPSTTQADISGIVGGATYYAAVSYVVSGETGDRLVLGPVTVADLDISGQLPSPTDPGFGGVLPLVDSDVPATFIQNPDGSLVYTEIN